MSLNGSGWKPTAFRRFVKSFPTALRTSIVETDLGLGYLKGVGGPEHPNCLACELVGTSLADWFSAETLDWSLLTIDSSDVIPLGDGMRVVAGTTFITRAEPLGINWSGDAIDLLRLENPETITDLVLLDTWFRNCDRHAPDELRVNRDNVFFVKSGNKRNSYRLKAMDFTHAFSCGHELTKRISNIEHWQDSRVYGLFPEFWPYLDLPRLRTHLQRLRLVEHETVRQIMSLIPAEWYVSNEVKTSWTSFLLNRAQFLSSHFEQILQPQLTLRLGA